MSAFTNMVDNARTHNFGGTSNSVACEPLISGYAFIKWYLPKTLKQYINWLKNKNEPQQIDSANDVTQAENFLSTQCIAVTPPSQSLDFNEWQCSAGAKFGNVKGVPYGNTLNIKYLEMSGLPIFRIHKAWVEYLKDAKTGIHVQMNNPGKLTVKDDYCGDVLYWTTKPDGITVEFAALYSGVQPSRDPQDSFGFDIGSIDKVEIDFEYHIDYIWTEPWVFKKAKDFSTKKPYGKEKTCWGGYVGKWGEGDVGKYEKNSANL